MFAMANWTADGLATLTTPKLADRVAVEPGSEPVGQGHRLAEQAVGWRGIFCAVGVPDPHLAFGAGAVDE